MNDPRSVWDWLNIETFHVSRSSTGQVRNLLEDRRWGTSSSMRSDAQYKAHSKIFIIMFRYARPRIRPAQSSLLNYCDVKEECNVILLRRKDDGYTPTANAGAVHRICNFIANKLKSPSRCYPNHEISSRYNPAQPYSAGLANFASSDQQIAVPARHQKFIPPVLLGGTSPLLSH